MLSQAASNTTCGTLACIFHTFTMQCCCVGFQFAPLLRTAVGTKERLSTGRPEYYNAASPGIKIISDHTDSDTTSIQITRHLNNQHQSQHFFPKRTNSTQKQDANLPSPRHSELRSHPPRLRRLQLLRPTSLPIHSQRHVSRRPNRWRLFRPNRNLCRW